MRRGRLVTSPITLDHDGRAIATEPFLDKRRSLNDVAPTAEGRIEPGQKIVGVCGQKPCALHEGGERAAQQESHPEQCPGKPDYVECDDVEGNAFAAVVLRVGVCESEGECCRWTG